MTSASNPKARTHVATGTAAKPLNALKHGLFSQVWIAPNEQQQYDELFSALREEYAFTSNSPTILIQIERLAMTIVKMRRLQKIENALYRKAQATAVTHAQEKIRLGLEPSASKSSKKIPDLSVQIAGDAALPDLMRLDTLARYQVSLDRQLSKIIGEIQILQDAQKARNSRGITVSEI